MAPSRMARTAPSMLAWAVISNTGTWGYCWRMLASRVRPSMPPIWMSEMTMSMLWRDRVSRARSPLSASRHS
ncbi:hypothetical protein D3C76_1507300 [compost metagenome]